MNTASLGYWCIPPTPLPDQMRTFKVYLLTQMEATVRKRGRAEVSQGVATLFKRRLHTNQRMQKQTLLGLVAFKPAEISCNSIQFLPMFVLAHTHTYKKAPLSLSLLAVGDKSTPFLPLPTSLSLLPSALWAFSLSFSSSCLIAHLLICFQISFLAFFAICTYMFFVLKGCREGRVLAPASSQTCEFKKKLFAGQEKRWNSKKVIRLKWRLVLWQTGREGGDEQVMKVEITSQGRASGTL